MEQLHGSASLRRIARWRFPVYALTLDDSQQDLVLLGKDGFYRVFFGGGRRVELPDGTPWRIRAYEVGHQIVPMVTCDDGKLAAASVVGKRSYGIAGRDFAYTFFLVRQSGEAKSYWSLWNGDKESAAFSRSRVIAHDPIPLAVDLLCFTLARYGVPGEAELLPAPGGW